jgi:hypothetical protein
VCVCRVCWSEHQCVSCLLERVPVCVSCLLERVPVCVCRVCWSEYQCVSCLLERVPVCVVFPRVCAMFPRVCAMFPRASTRVSVCSCVLWGRMCLCAGNTTRVLRLSVFFLRGRRWVPHWVLASLCASFTMCCVLVSLCASVTVFPLAKLCVGCLSSPPPPPHRFHPCSVLSPCPTTCPYLPPPSPPPRQRIQPGAVSLVTGSSSDANSGSVFVQTGDATAANSRAGNIVLSVGNSDGNGGAVVGASSCRPGLLGLLHVCIPAASWHLPTSPHPLSHASLPVAASAWSVWPAVLAAVVVSECVFS